MKTNKATILPQPKPKHESGTMQKVTLPTPSIDEAKEQFESWKAQYETLLREQALRKAEAWRITGHLDAEILPILDAAAEKAGYDSRAAWIVATIRKSLKVT